MKNLFTLLLFVLTGHIFTLHAQTSWKGTASTSWNNTANWTAGVPNASTDAVIGDANFTGSFQPTVSGNGGYCKNLTVGPAGIPSTLSIGRNLNCYGDVTIGTSGSILQNSNNRIITIKGNWSNSGTYSATGNNTSITFSGTAQSISGTTTFRSVTVNNGSTVTLNVNIAVTNSLSISGTFDPSTFTVSGTGALNAASGGTLLVKTATFAGNYGMSGSVTLHGTSTVHYASTTLAQTVSSSFTYGYLRISGGTTKSLAANLPALNSTNGNYGRVYVDGGTFNLSTFTCNRGSSGGSFTIANGATLRIAGTNSFPLNFSTVTLAAASTVLYCGTNQTITDYDYGNLIFESSSGAATKTMPASALVIAGSFTSAVGSGTSVNYTAAGTITVYRNVTIGASTTFNASAQSLIFKADFTNNGTFTGATSTVTFSGTGAVISGTGTSNFYNVAFTGNGITANAATAVNIGGNVSTTGAATFTHAAGGTTTLSGTTKTISGAGLAFCNLTIGGSITTVSSFIVSGNLNISGSIVASAPSSLNMSGAGKTITNTGTCSLYSLLTTGTISTASNVTLSGNISVPNGGSLTASAGIFTFDGTSSLDGTADLFNVTINGSKTLTLNANSVLGIASTFTKTGTLTVTTSVPNTVCYNGSGAQTIVNATYNNLVLATGGTKTPGGNFIVNRDLTINAGVTLNASAYSLTIHRHFTNAGTFTPGTSTITLAGTDVAIITGATTFYNLTENKVSPTISVELANTITATNLTITAGNMQTRTNSVVITGVRSGNGLITGTITHNHTFVTGTTYYFEGPNNSVTFQLPTATLTSVTIEVTPGPVADMNPSLESVNREYEVTIPNGTYTDVTFRYHYEDNELNAFTEPTLTLYKYNSGIQWDSVGYTSRNSTSNYIEYAGLTTLGGRYTASGVRSIVRWNGSVSTAWENPSNWTPVSGTNMTVRIPLSTDAAQIGHAAFINQPTLSTNQQIGLIEFGSTQNAVLTVSAGTLDVLGSIKGVWSTPASHQLNVTAGAISVGTYFLLSDGTNGHDIALQIGNGSVTINGDLGQNGTASVNFTGNGSLILAGHYLYTSGSFTAGSGTVNYSGSEAQDVAPLNYNHLFFTKSTARATINAPITVGGNLTTLSGGEVFADADIVVSGNVSLGAGTNFIENDVAISAGGNWNAIGLFTSNNGSVTFNGSGAQTVNANTFNTVIVNKASGTLTLTGSIIINSDLTLTAGTLNLDTYNANRSNTGGVLTLASGVTLQVGGTSNFPQNFAITNIHVTSTVDYNSASAQNIADVAYGNLVLTNGNAAGKSLIANTDVTGNLQINSGATFIPGALALSLSGNYTNNGTFTAGTSTLKLNGVSKTFTGSSTVCDLVVSGTYTVVSGSTSIAGDFTIQTGGSLDFGSNSVSLDGDLTVNGSLISNGVATFTGTRVQTLQIVNAIISSSTGVINFNGTVAPVLNSNTSPSFATVNINNTAGITPSVPWTVYFSFNVAAGAAFHGSALTHTFYGNFVNNGTVTSSGEMKFIPAAPFSSGATIQLDGTSFVSTGKVTFGGSVPMTISNVNPTLNLVSVTNTSAAGVTSPSSWTLSGELFVGSGSVFHCGSALSHTLAGNITNNGTINGQTSTITMTGSGVTITGLGTCNFTTLIIAAAADVTLNKNINISSNLVVDGLFTTSGRTVAFNGTTPSVISGLAGALTLDDMEQNKTGSTTSLSIPVLVTGSLTLTNGIVFTSSTNLLTLTDDATSSDGTGTSYVDGPMKKIGDDAFVFPVGDGAFWARLGISAPALATDAFTAQYFAAAYTNTTNMAASPSPVINNVSTIEYWTCDRSAGTSSVSVTLYWESAGRSVINNYSPDLVVARWNGSAWANAGQSAIDPANPGYVTSNSTSSFGPFTFGSLSGSNPLPIELVSFTATLNDQQEVDLAWQTDVEINNDYFTIERTADGVTYETVAIVDGAGTSSQQHHYTAVDHSPLAGLSFYRLKQTDANGNFTYSQLRSITNDAQAVTATDVYPNPCDGSGVNVNVTATSDENITITLLDASGKECFRESFVAGNDGENLLRLEFTSMLQPGVYFLYTTLSGKTSGQAPAPQKVVVQ